MTWFKTEKDKAVTEEEKKETEKIEETTTELLSRIKADAKLWEDATKLSDMLSYCRPHQSRTERQYIAKHIIPLGVKFDGKGNIYKRIGDAPVLWSSHTDTVHSKKGRQGIEYWVDQKSGDTFFGAAKKSHSSCLGADDTAGNWLMLEMIKAQVPGLYIFHRGEECGGIGSRWIAQHNQDAVKDIRFAIAFDRKDTHSIITFQRSSRCCSDEFAESLADQLDMGHRRDEGGSFTDTASYTDLIPECTNVSVGYYDAHMSSENLNVDYLFRLRDALCKIDTTKLVEKRKAGENERKSYSYYGSSYGGYYDEYNDWSNWGQSGWGTKKSGRLEYGYYASELNYIYGPQKWFQWFEYEESTGRWYRIKGVTIPADAIVKTAKDLGVTKGWKQTKLPLKGEKRPEPTPLQIKWLIQDNHEIIFDLIESFGYDASSLRDYIEVAGGNSTCK